MTRMTRHLSSLVSLTLFSVVVSLTAVGCGPSKKDLKIQDLTSENDQLKNDINERDRQLNDAIVRENEARDTIGELNTKLAAMGEEAKKSKNQNAEGWITMPSFDMISVPGSVLFASGKATLSHRGRSTLAKIASDIRSQFSDREIYVFGHTDNQPIRKSKWKDNWELGAARSLNVVRTLRNFGIPNDHLVQANCGPYQPKTANSNAKGRSQNRRVEFYAVRSDSGILNHETARGLDSE